MRRFLVVIFAICACIFTSSAFAVCEYYYNFFGGTCNKCTEFHEYKYRKIGVSCELCGNNCAGIIPKDGGEGCSTKDEQPGTYYSVVVDASELRDIEEIAPEIAFKIALMRPSEIIDPVERSLNVTYFGSIPLAGDAVKYAATGDDGFILARNSDEAARRSLGVTAKVVSQTHYIDSGSIVMTVESLRTVGKAASPPIRVELLLTPLDGYTSSVREFTEIHAPTYRGVLLEKADTVVTSDPLKRAD